MTQTETTTDAIKLRDIVARRSYHWTCPECNATQFCEKSKTHTAQCNRCRKLFTVHLPEGK